ncbi:MAG TPA: NAD-dependent epimerase/dehydratase family protein [Candidatus Woesebacteria bacterium]|nr:NAD-dependent epimerase/dehydratase family protein [Candidatus Woesebacteria bacterium]
MKIIVTGGSGFLGRHLLRALRKAGHHLVNIDLVVNPEFETVVADVRDQARMNQLIKDADVVFHLASLIEAGESVREPAKYLDYNLFGTLAVLEAMRLNNVKTFIFSSSAAIYGEPQRTPIQEDDRTLPINPYGVTKLAMEGLLNSYVSSFGFTGIALRYFNLYGPEEHHQPETHAIPRFIDQLLHDQPITVWGDGSHQRDFVYIDDIVVAHLVALDYSVKNPAKHHYFNLSTGTASSVLSVIEQIAQILGKTPQIEHHQFRPGDPLVLLADPSKAQQQLGWKAQVNLPAGLKLTIEYFKNI